MANPQARASVLAGVSYAEQYPAIAALMEGPGGLLWVQRVRPASQFAPGEALPLSVTLQFYSAGMIASTTWHVFGTDARYLGEIELPPRFKAMRVVGDRVYGVATDELDVQYVVRLRVVG